MLSREEIERAAAVLRAGGVVVYPTETFYGLGGCANQIPAVERILALKGRAEGKPLPVIAASLEQAARIVAAWPGAARRLAARFWPGPLTLVLPAAPGLPREIAPAGEVGVRVSSHPVARALALAAGFPIVSTSANLSGGPEVSDPRQLDPRLAAHVLDAGPTPGGRPSTVVRVTDSGLELLREGALPFERLRTW